MFRNCVLLVALTVMPLDVLGKCRLDAANLWSVFKQIYRKQYRTSNEELDAYDCFVQNLDLMDDLNDEENHGAYGINAFADLCPEQFQFLYTGFRPNNRTKNYAMLGSRALQQATLAKSVDWRGRGAVTHVKDQGQCGSCWAFSATGNLEGLNFLKTGKLLSISEQELVSCSRPNGCAGGIMDEAFAWVKSNGGITTEQDYPYSSGRGGSGICNRSKLKHHAVSVRGFVDIPEDEAQMAAWVAKQGPLSVAVNADSGWQLYVGGIKTLCGSLFLNHAVLIVGYGTTPDGVKYWIIKNSWGDSWGESGYIRLLRGANCNGVAMHAVSALLAS